ncbi:MAG: DUF1499 domain-containing protein [Pseudomonadota bacterium]|nr:DUF1499 domain-containing protein [Pseudomonadota bacterium]
MAEQSSWKGRFANGSIRLTLVAVAVAAVGLTLARYDVVPKLAGFMAFLGGGLLAAVALLLGIIALLIGRQQALPARGKLLAAMAVALVFAGFIASRPLVNGDVPAIHDITTDLANPPQFEAITVRADNLVGVGTVENWKKLHAAAYGDLRPLEIARPVAQVTADAVRLAQAQGWKIVKSDPARGHVEATASVSYIRFQDDIVLRIVPTEDGAGSRVDMRSISRIGVSDLGVNAKRIRAFQKALSEIASASQ